MFTREEKAVVSRYLARDISSRSYWYNFAPYLIPPVAFAAFGLWRTDFLGMAVAFGVLLFLALWYLSYGLKSSVSLQSALRKYENAVNALEQPEADGKN